MSDLAALAATLRGAALGGRVTHTSFLEPDEADALLRAVRGEGVAADAWGGYPGARRRVVSARPEHVPEATATLHAWYVPGAAAAEGEVRASLLAAGVDAGDLGDVVRHTEGWSVIVAAAVATPERVTLAGHPCRPERLPVERVVAGSLKRVQAVVPALRVDVLGARAFGVSRSYFAKGVAAGHVHINGRAADKRGEATRGDEVYAQGLGRFRVLDVLGETRRGNLRVELEVERA